MEGVKGGEVTAEDAWTLVVVAGGLAAIAIFWSVLLARGALRSRKVLVEAVKALGDGDLSRRLQASEVGAGVAASFNQAARDLDERMNAASRAEMRLRELAGGMQNMVLLGLGGEGEVQEILGDLETLMGHPPAAVLGRHASFFFAAENDWESLKSQLDRRGSGMTTVREAALRTQGGELFMGQVSLAAVPGGRSVLTLCRRARDMDLEQRLKLAEARLEALTTGIADAMLLVVDGRIGSVNQRFSSLLGMSPEKLLERPLADLVSTSDLVKVLGLLSGEPGENASEIAEISFQPPGGQDVVLAVSVGQTGIGDLRFQMVIAREVTEKEALHRRLALYGAWLAAALEANQDGLAVLAHTSRQGIGPVALCNGAFTRLLGLEAGHLPGERELSAALHRVFADPEGVQALMGAREGSPASKLYETVDESPRFIEIASSPIHDDEGQVGCLLTIRDVTQQRRLEESLRKESLKLQESLEALRRTSRELKRANDELAGRISKLETLNRELGEVDEMKTNLLGNVSHELQTPLVSIKGYTEMMLRGDLGPISAEQRQGLEVALRNIKRLIHLIEQLLSFSRAEEKLADLTLEEFPLWQLLDETISLLGDRIKSRGLRVTTRYETERLVVQADRNLIGQVLINLLGNAVKYNREGGEIAVTVQTGAVDELVVAITDSGVGIPREEQERIFDRGYRASTAGETRGNGIGLALVREILKHHGCQVRVDSRPGEGS
ncbi:MAG: ATP-binding protein, partial [Acidobacteriota bacterium]